MRIISLLTVSLFLFSFNPKSYTYRYGKKIDRELKIIFRKESAELKIFMLPDNIYLGTENEFYKVISGNELIGYANINRVNACRVGGCSSPGPLNTVRYDHFYYLAVFDIDFSILKVVVLDYQSDYGYEICSKNWLKQFIGSNERRFSYDENIDAISGATVSVNAIIDEMNSLISAVERISDYLVK